MKTLYETPEIDIVYYSPEGNILVNSLVSSSSGDMSVEDDNDEWYY